MSSNLILTNKQKILCGVIGLSLALIAFANISYSYVFAVVEDRYSTTATGLDENGNKMSYEECGYNDNSSIQSYEFEQPSEMNEIDQRITDLQQSKTDLSDDEKGELECLKAVRNIELEQGERAVGNAMDSFLKKMESLKGQLN